MERKNWLLIAIASAWDEAITPLELHHALFRFSREVLSEEDREGFYNFRHGDYGPFPNEVEVDRAQLPREKLIVEIPQDKGRTFGVRGLLPTPKGLREAQTLAALRPTEARKLILILQELHELGFRATVADTYQRYPEFKGRGVFPDG